MTVSFNERVLHMLKEGKDPMMIREIIAADNKKAYKPIFIDFMQDMIEKYHVKRTQIADVTGISRDYLYKVLNGQKTTAERDYVIAICLGIGMNFPETQHALQINGMAILNNKDFRDYILINGISEKRSITDINIWLHDAGFPILRVSQDMEQYVPRIEYDDAASFETAIPMRRRHFKEISREIEAEPCGNAPFDYTYWGNIVVEDEESNRYHVQGFFAPDFTSFNVIDEENYQKNRKWVEEQKQPEQKKETFVEEHYQEIAERIKAVDLDELLAHPELYFPEEMLEEDEEPESPVPWQTLEQYDSIEETYDSDFFRFFAEIDRATDEKVAEVLGRLDDTAAYGFRANIKLNSNGVVKYAEMYDAVVPERQQYYQIIESDDKTIYSASHESAFMRIELGPIYPSIFGGSEQVKYFFYQESEDGQTTDIEDVRARFMFNQLKANMHAFLNHAVEGLEEAETDEETLFHEMTETLANHGAWQAMHGDFEGALKANLQLFEMIEPRTETKNYLSILLSTIGKIRICYGNLGDEEKAQEWSNKALEYEDQVMAALAQGEEVDGAVATLAEVLFDIEQEYNKQKNVEKTKEYAYKLINLLKGHCDDVFGWGILFVAYLNLGYFLDEENKSEEALQYYERAEEIIRQQSLDTHPRYRHSVLSFYNNYAWVLWNRFENQEAIFYYGKAIELTENYMNSARDYGEDLHPELEHYSAALLKLYRQIGREKEAARLIQRVKKG